MAAQAAVPLGIFVIIVLLASGYGALITPNGGSIQCPPPALPLNARIALSNETREAGTIATYLCDDGYQAFGSSVRTCGPAGDWSGSPPICGVNVAYRKPTNQSTSVRGGDSANAVDGNLATLHDGRYCTETRREKSPWWSVDLLQPYAIHAVRIIGRKCCGGQTLQSMEIRVGNSSDPQNNRMCAFRSQPLEAGATHDFLCIPPLTGRYVSVTLGNVDTPLSLCEVQAFTTQEFSRERCAGQSDPKHVSAFKQRCYEVHLDGGANFKRAREECIKAGGDIVQIHNNATQNFLASELERLKGQMSTQLLWIGAQKEPGSASRTWRWVKGPTVRRPLWGEDQPNNYNGEQNCVVMDGGRGWLWNDVGCNLDYLLWICELQPATCGSPDREQNTTLALMGGGLQVGSSVAYLCSEDSRIVGDANRTCLPTGFWSGKAPTCQYTDCGPLDQIDMGQMVLVQNRTTYGAIARYRCHGNHSLDGYKERRCGDDGNWEGEEPSCKLNLCTEPLHVLNATVHVTGVHAGDTATYACFPGHWMEGKAVLTCQLGGDWSAVTPSCKYVDCSLPRTLPRGSFLLPDNTTTYGSRVSYHCSDHHVLRGLSERTCQSDGKWSGGEEPSCEIISCGEPDVSEGSYVVGYEFTVGAEVEYFCDPGYVMKGAKARTCDPSGNWTGSAPTCKYVDCGRVQPAPYAVLEYLNGTTHGGSLVAYECTSAYRLVGNATRLCQDNGRWNGTTPTCQEIRCPEPQRPLNSVLSVSGNDRAGSGDSFKIGSTLQFRCEGGFRLEGSALSSCNASGQWSQEPPTCAYVECPPAADPTHGQVTLDSKAAFLGSKAHYSCDTNFELIGEAERLCLDNATWAGKEPICQEITCGPPDKPPSVDSVSVEAGPDSSTRAIYRCAPGRRLVGNDTRYCHKIGKWTGNAPECHLVDCGRPPAVENGRAYLVDQATRFNSSVEYHCFPGYQRKGPDRLLCGEDGTWGEKQPICILDVSNNEVLSHHAGNASFAASSASASGPGEEHVASARTVGITIGVGSGVLLLVLIGTALLYMRLRGSKPDILSPAPKANTSPSASPPPPDVTT